VADWSRHISKIIAFWSTALCGSKCYRGNPMLLHRALPDLSPAIFERWLDLFHEAASTVPNRAMVDRAGELSPRIGQSFWYNYQLQRDPQQMPRALPRRVTAL
ncbi:MAG: group III truncated hemoglobin, partial [Burkholderiaceae bacterium]